MIYDRTSSQKHFYTINRIQPIDRAYNIVSSVKITGLLDRDRLEKAWAESLKNYRAMASDHELEKLAIAYDKCDDESTAMQKIRESADGAFDLKSGLPLKAVLLSQTDEIHYFTVIQHHSITDLHCKIKLAKVLEDFYNRGFSNSQSLPCLEELDEDLKKKQADFWEHYIGGATAGPLVLPGGTSSRDTFTGEGHTEFSSLNQNLCRELSDYCKKTNSDLFLVFLTTYAVLLHKLSEQNSFYLGVPFANRRQKDRLEMFCPFVNILPLRISIDEEETIKSLYGKIRKDMLFLHRNQETPFQEIARFYNGERDRTIPYFLQAGFTREEPFRLNLKDLHCQPLKIRPAGAQMDLFLTYWQEEDSIEWRWEYNSRTFSKDQIISWMGSFEKGIEYSISHADTLIKNLSLMSDRDRGICEEYYSRGKRSYPLQERFSDLLISAYKHHRAETAIQDDHRAYTFEEFGNIVGNISSYIYNRFGQNRIIAVAMDRSIERTAIVHGIVCSGNAYLPVDPLWPDGRKAYMIGNAGAVVLIRDGNDRYSADNGIPTITAEELFSEEKGCFPETDTGTESPIALLYTSGSTGMPKGVFIPGRGIVNRLYWMQETYPVNPGDSLIHKVPYTFDVSLWEIFWPFLFGARLFIPGPFDHLDQNRLASLIAREKITYIHFVPSLLRSFLEGTAGLISLPGLKGVICSGEALKADLLEAFFRRFDGIEVHNLYGPTEASIDVTFWNCSADDIKKSAIPIGFPIVNTRIYILDRNGNLCPPYVWGEIAIAGENLSTGYINNEVETERRFVSGDWGWGSERIYLTGDIGRFREGMIIDYQGRRDHQIKLKGVRIELGEIETQIKKTAEADDVLVMVKGDLLSAYIKNAGIVEENRIKTILQSVLPGNMIPTDYYFLNDFPQLGNGKIDRQQLLSLKNPVTKMQEAGIVGKENSLTKIWKELLKLEDIDENANFFDLGGHSLLIPLLKDKIESQFKCNVEMIDLFSHTTIKTQKLLLETPETVESREPEQSLNLSARRASIKNRYKRT
ncbi:MAG: amino acid adenylation domain-containing protein [Spirochaetales bacterium]|nr:amino acid adenylation domain-containing protein [Spirochaetales bacterium]